MKMWKEVFNVDDGAIRLYNDPEHREFLASVMKGEIPQELLREARGGEVAVDMEDHRNEEFVKPGVKPNTTQKAGNVIVGGTPEQARGGEMAGSRKPKNFIIGGGVQQHSLSQFTNLVVS